MILTAVLAGILSGMTVITGLIVLFYLVFRRGRKGFLAFTQPPGENQPSQLAILIDSIAQVFAQRITNTVKSTLMGMSSVDSKNERALTGEVIAGFAASKYPALAAIMAAIPSLRKRITKNPELAGVAQKILAGLSHKNGEKQPENPVQLTF